MRVGILGGTFDPIHLGHLVVAEDARERVRLDRVIFIPTGQPWLKEGQPISAAHHRLAMVEHAISSNPFFAASGMEIDRPGPTYTVDTLRALRTTQVPGTELLFILGADSLVDFHRWKDPAAVLDLCTVVAYGRPGYGTERLAGLERRLGSTVRDKMIVVSDGPQIGVSGTDIRRRVAAGRSVRYLVPDGVHDYIEKHKLYQGEGESP